MAVHIFTFSFDEENQTAVTAGNIPLKYAFQLLQQLYIADEIRKARERELDKKSKDDTIDTQTEKEVKDAG